MCLELHPQQVERREGAREGARERESERESVCARACVCMCFASRTCACISPACAGPPRSTKALRCVYTCRSKGDRCAAIASACPRAPACRTSTSATSSTARRTAYAAAGAAMHANTALRTHPPPPGPDRDVEFCSGGVVVTNSNGKIRCDNTLDGRLEVTRQALLPFLREELFGKVAKSR